MNGINWTHLLTLTLSPEKGSNELKTNGALNEALPMGIIAYVVMAILTYLIACITISIVSYSFFTIFSFTTLLGLIVKGLLKAVIPALLASYIFNFYCNRTYPTIKHIQTIHVRCRSICSPYTSTKYYICTIYDEFIH